jgi:hypothetical protein
MILSSCCSVKRFCKFILFSLGLDKGWGWQMRYTSPCQLNILVKINKKSKSLMQMFQIDKTGKLLSQASGMNKPRKQCGAWLSERAVASAQRPRPPPIPPPIPPPGPMPPIPARGPCPAHTLGRRSIRQADTSFLGSQLHLFVMIQANLFALLNGFRCIHFARCSMRSCRVINSLP